MDTNIRETRVDKLRRKQREQKEKKHLYFTLCTSIGCVCISCLCLLAITYAWFFDVGTARGSNVGTGIMAVELYNVEKATPTDLSATDTDWFPTPTDITAEDPVFKEYTFTNLATDTDEYVTVINNGNVRAEYNIGFTATETNLLISEEDLKEGVVPGDLSDKVQVFFKFMDRKTGEDMYQDEAENDFIYLGTLKEIQKNNTKIRGILEPNYEELERKGLLVSDKLSNVNRIKTAVDEDTYDYKQVICIRLRMPKEIEEKYSNCSFKLNLTLDARTPLKRIHTVRAYSDNEDRGLVIGGGTYYEEEEINIIELTPFAEKGFRFTRWKNEGTDNPKKVKVIADDTGRPYIAIFELDNEYEEGYDDDPWGDEPEDEPFDEDDVDPFA